MPQPANSSKTFLFTDIESSTHLWELYPDAMEAALQRHDIVMRDTIESNDGVVFKTVGDAFCAVFADSSAAIRAAVSAQIRLDAEDWDADLGALQVRVAIHTGEARERADDYFGPAINRVARLCAVAHGGQIVASQSTEEAARGHTPKEFSLLDLGRHRLRDLSRSEHVFQILYPGIRSEFPPLNVLDRFPNNLPVQLTTLVGRDGELRQLRSLLGTSRLVTLTGTGGCGKTRLALQLVADCLDDYPDGAWLVEFAALADPTLVTQTVASALGLREEPVRPLQDTLIGYIESRRLLLLLDNCEHVIEQSAQLADALLHSCSDLRILATSREGLAISGELVYPVPSLQVPEPVSGAVTAANLQEVSGAAAVHLFVDRATLSKPSFELTASNVAAVVDICRRLDGIPLTIELAAARVRLLPVNDIQRRVDDRFRLLTGGSRTALPRHQTLRAAIDWSHDLLSTAEQSLLRRLTVFRGGWSLAAAESVCSSDGIEEPSVLELLGRLVDKSLVQANEERGEGRYSLLQTIRYYAAEKLAASGETDTVRDQHLEYYVGMAEQAEGQLRGEHQADWLDRLELVHDNMRAALGWAYDQEYSETSLRLCTALWRFWYMRGYWAEGQRLLEAALELPGATSFSPKHADALSRRGSLLFAQGDLAGAWEMYCESLAIRRALGEEHGIAADLNNLGLVAAEQGDYVAARNRHEESLAILRTLGDQQGVSDALNNLGNLAADEGDYDGALLLYEQSLAIGRELGQHQGVANSLNNLGEIARIRGDLERAQALYIESLSISRQIGDKRLVSLALGNLGAVYRERGDYDAAIALHQESVKIRYELGHKLGVADSLEEFSRLAAAQECHERAARLLGAAGAMREALAAPLPPADRALIDEAMRSSRIALGESAFEAALAEGRTLTVGEAVEYAATNDP